MDRRDKVLRKARKPKSDNDWMLYKRLRNFCNNRLKTARKNYHRNMLNEIRLNLRNFWRAIKSNKFFQQNLKLVKINVAHDHSRLLRVGSVKAHKDIVRPC